MIGSDEGVKLFIRKSFFYTEEPESCGLVINKDKGKLDPSNLEASVKVAATGTAAQLSKILTTHSGFLIIFKTSRSVHHRYIKY